MVNYTKCLSSATLILGNFKVISGSDFGSEKLKINSKNLNYRLHTSLILNQKKFNMNHKKTILEQYANPQSKLDF